MPSFNVAFALVPFLIVVTVAFKAYADAMEDCRIYNFKWPDNNLALANASLYGIGAFALAVLYTAVATEVVPGISPWFSYGFFVPFLIMTRILKRKSSRFKANQARYLRSQEAQ